MVFITTLIGIALAIVAVVMFGRSWYYYRFREDLIWCLMFGAFGGYAAFHLIKETL